jgi:hypothetical protein
MDSQYATAPRSPQTDQQQAQVLRRHLCTFLAPLLQTTNTL